MTTKGAVLEKPTVTNGVNVDQVVDVTGGLNRSRFQGFYCGGKEDTSRASPFYP
ncbi:MAG: hypothetical protein QF393_14835 [Rhodospirillales bacterium]|jgi:hypothetical protein|nr:hypothetical protein [Rhodospirillales bacterium]MDP6643776.1 hypothetical protein [Rhodospirillales bacterium]|tara:strand:+ start:1986 stop:2147 length:162 start_codon:yes stop_codon:yes gene_type:complete